MTVLKAACVFVQMLAVDYPTPVKLSGVVFHAQHVALALKALQFLSALSDLVDDSYVCRYFRKQPFRLRPHSCRHPRPRNSEVDGSSPFSQLPPPLRKLPKSRDLKQSIADWAVYSSTGTNMPSLTSFNTTLV